MQFSQCLKTTDYQVQLMTETCSWISVSKQLIIKVNSSLKHAVRQCLKTTDYWDQLMTETCSWISVSKQLIINLNS